MTVVLDLNADNGDLYICAFASAESINTKSGAEFIGDDEENCSP